MQFVATEAAFAVVQGLNDHPGDLGLPEIERPGVGSIEDAVHGREGLPASQVARRKNPVCGQAAMQSEGDKEWRTHDVPMRKAALVTLHLDKSPTATGELSPKVARLAAQRGCPTSSGVTLIEMLVVVTIIGLMAGIAFPAVSAGLDSVRLRSATDSIAAFLNAAVVRAERRQEPIELTISAKDSTLALYANEPGFTRELKMPDGIVIEAAPERLILLPGAGVPGIGIQVANRHGSRRVVHLDPMTGFPRVESVETK